VTGLFAMAEVLRLAETFPGVFRDFALMGFNVALGKKNRKPPELFRE
jgi:hypothetical protein